MKTILLALFLASCALTGFAKEYSDADYKLAYQLLDVIGTKKDLEGTTEKMLDLQMKAAPMLVPYRQILVDFFKKYISYEQLKKPLAEIYLDIYTPAEIKGLLAFYNTPLGKKVAEKNSELALRAAQVGQNAVLKHAGELQEALKAAMEKQKAAQKAQQK